MSPQKPTFNQFNIFPDLYLENMIQKPLLGICISESIPYGLASKNSKAVPLLAKYLVEKLDK